MSLDDASRSLIEQLSAVRGRPLWEMSPHEARQAASQLKDFIGSGPQMVSVDDTDLESDDGATFLVRVLRPTEEPTGIVVYLHGGGWVTGHIDEFDTLGRRMAERTGAAVLLVNYRKAPENPFPAGLEDAWRALRWAADNAERIAGRPVPLVVAGDSAGGNLAAVLALRARDRNGPSLAAQILVYPVIASDFESPSYRDPDNVLLLTGESMSWYWNHYVAAPGREHPDVSPIRAEDLSGLPPALVLLAEHDVLRSEGELYAAALRQAGVDVDLVVVPGQMHGFFTMVNLLPGQELGMQHVTTTIRAALGAEEASSQ